ncbi:ankyrin repeat domain-containing protein [Nostoc sp. CENA67]|uniref:Ankyrin repeat domain-containing protein n=1 Tax=Amazonocrinis nigriterrae CENA67 TaxID=2794033 RepID=A0A8J7L750_9NOST|nr:ankyrin repeat domain-containing protein [Amazonocrinis nigriterrae]MBH8561968.1 ankyrin repeat domain-containing protein [Amazonocrinis nigriterrae CENA67]
MQDTSNFKQKYLLGKALETALKKGDTSSLKQLIQNRININIRLDDEQTSLMEAVRAGDINVVRMLVEAGADVNAQDNSGLSAIWKAAYWGLQEIFDYLAPLTSFDLRQEAQEILPKGLVYRQRADDNFTEDFIASAAIGDSNAVLAAIRQGVNVNAIGSDGTPALVPSAFWGHIPVVKLLLKHGADVNCKTEDEQKTPLIAAAEGTSLARYPTFTSLTTDENQITVIKLLLEMGADINAKTNEGRNALMAVANAGSINSVQLLIRYGAKIDGKDNRVDTALSLAKLAGHTDIVNFLLKTRAKED